ncbi:MAG: aldehyde dehydrogenase [Firmicutes bacterium]|nr:aldehyde dehydrogenase [Bacillota bacterium]
MQVDEKRIAIIVEEVLRQLGQADGKPTERVGQDGIFEKVDDAARAAAAAQRQLVAMPLAARQKIIDAIREAAVANAERFARMTVEETGLGRYEHKVEKNINAARLSPGIEDLSRDIQGGDDGITITQRIPYGLIVSITPTTHPTPFVTNHAIIMLAGGNTVFFCPHPRAQGCSREAIRVLNRAIVAAGGPPNCLVAVNQATLDIVNEACRHPLVAMVTAAGGPGVVNAALSCGKKAVAAGAANPPVVVDETADIAKAAQDILKGAWFDNNVLCIAEKTVFAVESIAAQLQSEMQRHGAYLLLGKEADRVTQLVVKDGRVVGDWVGKDGAAILKAAGINPPPGTEGAIMPVAHDHPLVKIEQMLPVLPIVKVKDFTTGLRLAYDSEQGFGHTAIIHSRDVERISLFAKTMETTIVMVNGPSYGSLGIDGTGNFAHTIASPTGEGICVPRTFTRQQNLTMAGGLTFA